MELAVTEADLLVAEPAVGERTFLKRLFVREPAPRRVLQDDQRVDVRMRDRIAGDENGVVLIEPRLDPFAGVDQIGGEGDVPHRAAVELCEVGASERDRLGGADHRDDRGDGDGDRARGAGEVAEERHRADGGEQREGNDSRNAAQAVWPVVLIEQVGARIGDDERRERARLDLARVSGHPRRADDH